MTTEGLTFITKEQATAIIADLISAFGFCIEQVTELIGQSVASAVALEYPVSRFRRICILSGNGTNGCYGLVAARHLGLVGYDVKVCCLAAPPGQHLYQRLLNQCKSWGIQCVAWEDVMEPGLPAVCELVVDAMSGVDTGTNGILKGLRPDSNPPPIVSIDIPCGWDVDLGPVDVGAPAIRPDMLVSVLVPKLGAKAFQGHHHYLGGFFLPKAIQQKYKLQLPAPQQVALCLKLNDPKAARDVVKVADMRISYERGGMDDEDLLGAHPMAVWDSWLQQAVLGKVCEEPNIMHLATADADGQPAVRAMLLKGFSEDGFVFFTNYDSRKGHDLVTNKHAAFAVYWEKLQRQVRVEGIVEQLPEEESTAYFHSRPRGSQIGAWVSHQSQPLCGGRMELEARAAEVQQLYAAATTPVPKPPHWGGYLLRPTSIEFWQGRPSRLHDRIRFKRASIDVSVWVMERLQP